MRISDWSSYVCSSDLAQPAQPCTGRQQVPTRAKVAGECECPLQPQRGLVAGRQLPPPEHAGPQYREQQHLAIRHLLLSLNLPLPRSEDYETVRRRRHTGRKPQYAPSKTFSLSHLTRASLRPWSQMKI